MNKKKLYLFLALITAILIFTTSALCNQCNKAQPEEAEVEEEPAAEEIAGEDAVEEETTEELEKDVAEAEEDITAEEEVSTDEKKELPEEIEEEAVAPTITLVRYEGPIYSSGDGVCYYRIEAIITGNPTPTVDFSKDDSSGAWGPTKCQVNLNDPAETYTLVAKATNSEGYATDSIILTWGCSEGLEEEEAGDGEGEVFEGTDISIITPEMFLTLDRLELQPSHIGYIVHPSGINTETAILGDSISNETVVGYFGFGDLSGFSGRVVSSVSLTLNTYKYWGDVPVEIFGNIKGVMVNSPIFPLDPLDLYGDTSISMFFDHFQEPIIWTGTNLKNEIQARINDGQPIEFKFYYTSPTDNTDGDNQIDGREYRKQDVRLIIEFSD